MTFHKLVLITGDIAFHKLVLIIGDIAFHKLLLIFGDIMCFINWFYYEVTTNMF